MGKINRRFKLTLSSLGRLPLLEKLKSAECGVSTGVMDIASILLSLSTGWLRSSSWLRDLRTELGWLGHSPGRLRLRHSNRSGLGRLGGKPLGLGKLLGSSRPGLGGKLLRLGSSRPGLGGELL